MDCGVSASLPPTGMCNPPTHPDTLLDSNKHQETPPLHVRYTGPNQLLHETIMLYAQDPRYGVKESQALARIPDTLVCAMEFILMPNAPVRA